MERLVLSWIAFVTVFALFLSVTAPASQGPVRPKSGTPTATIIGSTNR